LLVLIPSGHFRKTVIGELDGNIVLIEAGELHQAPDFTKHHLFQKIHSDIVGGSTAPAVALIVGAVEILDLRVALIEMEAKIAATISADQKAGEHVMLAFVGAALADFSRFCCTCSNTDCSMIDSWTFLKMTQFSWSFSNLFLFL
jgi:hypothetical protein